MPILHVSLPTGQKHYKAMRDFYVTILAPLGYGIYYEKDEFLGLGPKNGNPDFWLHAGSEEFSAFGGNVEKRGGKTHVAFEASSRKQVDEWYALALKAGGTDNGKPDERQYTAGYYAAYVIDPLGNNIELAHWSPLWLKLFKSLPLLGTGLVGAAASVGIAKYLGY